MKTATILLSLNFICLSSAWADASALPETGAAVPDPVLVKIESREFLFNQGLSSPGTLAVDRVRYRLEVLDPHGDTNLAPGNRLQVDLPGGCAELMQVQSSYLIPLTTTAQGWTANCEIQRSSSADAALALH